MYSTIHRSIILTVLIHSPYWASNTLSLIDIRRSSFVFVYGKAQPATDKDVTPSPVRCMWVFHSNTTGLAASRTHCSWWSIRTRPGCGDTNVSPKFLDIVLRVARSWPAKTKMSWQCDALPTWRRQRKYSHSAGDHACKHSFWLGVCSSTEDVHNPSVLIKTVNQRNCKYEVLRGVMLQRGVEAQQLGV